MTDTIPIWACGPLDLKQFDMITDDDLVIDGYSQSGFIGTDTNSEGPEIELDGSLLTNSCGLQITRSGVVIAGLVINRFGDAGIEFILHLYVKQL